ncbi:uncharacterized protein LOC134811826 [Bolinopsis microptera]|uniref:uncharacterized protein LOC134811826 n=1 Tax=Bolinopsis microptera TaxID=2820187 RepID=UPI0030790C4F
MSDEELEMFTGLNISFYRPTEGLSMGGAGRLGAAADLPQSVNWYENGNVTETKAQGSCGSCWAFAAVASLESHYAIKTGTLKTLSEQQLLDCTYSDYGYDGCQGGWMGDAFKQIRNKLGNRLATSETYGYTGKGGSECVTNIFTKRGTKVVNALVAANLAVTSYTQVEFNDNEKEAPFEKNLARAVSIGPVTVAIEVVNAMYTYGQGVYDEKNCKNQVNHAVTVVGYDSDVFVIKNSWGSGWGEKGYIKFDRKISNQCFIGEYPEYPNLKLTGEEEDNSEDENPCEPNPCQNRGKCQKIKEDGVSTYKCKCNKKFIGSQCQDKVATCKDKSRRCPTNKNDDRCLARRKFYNKKCKLSCGFCYL